MPFSRRTAWSRHENALTGALASARAGGAAVLDLTESNPTRAELFDARALVATLGHERGVRYEPEAFGHAEAREAVARYYGERGVAVPAGQVVLSASTSEAYGWLWKLLCDPGDEVIVLAPSYPLFSFLSDLEGVRLVTVPLSERRGFRLEIGELEAALTERTRAIVLVHPNNPTGTFVHPADRALLVAIAAERELALVVDEVFGDYAFDDALVARPPTFAGETRALTFVLSGLSKVVALPQVKLGWLVVAGPEALRAEALARLELVADTYLSVATPVQRALPEILAARRSVGDAIRARTRANLARLDAALAGRHEVHRLAMDAGWYAVLAAPGVPDEERFVEQLAAEQHVLVHPGYFFDFPVAGRYIVSLLTMETAFAEGIARLLAALAQSSRS
jgi:alanine-synthesizing transaminase